MGKSRMDRVIGAAGEGEDVANYVYRKEGPIEPDERRANAIVSRLASWRDGPNAPSEARFGATVRFLIERLEALEIGDDDWEEWL